MTTANTNSNSADEEAETPPAVEPANDSREAIEWLFGFKRTWAVIAVVLTAVLSFISVVGTIIGMIFVIACALRTSRGFRVGLVASIVVSLLVLPYAIALSLSLFGMHDTTYSPGFLPRPISELDETSSCQREMMAREKAGNSRWAAKRQGIWWAKPSLVWIDCGMQL
jgi:hypothetical protein